MSSEPVVPASPSTVGLMSDEALILRDMLAAHRDEFLRGQRSLHEDIAGITLALRDLTTSVQLVAESVHRANDSSLAIRRAVLVESALRAEATKRAEAHAKNQDERTAYLVRRAQRDHDVLTDVRTKVPEADILPWFRRSWRPVLVGVLGVIVTSSLTACLTVTMLDPTHDTVDASRPAPTFIYPDRQP